MNLRQKRWFSTALPIVTAVLLAAPELAAQSYDMLDYMRHNDQAQANMLELSGGGVQPIRDYNDGTNRFFIVKSFADPQGRGPEYEEYTWDPSYIYLVRDTSWQPEHWCNGQQTSFELWTGQRNRGARFPRFVTSGSTYNPPGSVIKARKEGNGCALCNSPSDSDGQVVSATYRFDRLPTKTFNTGVTLSDVMKVTVTAGVGQGEIYYFSKTLGFVGYEDAAGWAHYDSPGGIYEVVALHPCPGAGGCTWYQSRAPNVYHQIGESDGLDWSANVTEHGAGYLSYGPYDPKWGVGTHRALWYLQIDNRSANNDVVATIDVVTAAGTRVLARRDVRRMEFTSTYTWQWFALYFDYPSFEQVEVRIYWHDRAYIKHGGTYICKP